MKSVQSINQYKSVIQTIYEIVKAHSGELKGKTLSAEAAAQAEKKGEGTTFIIQLPI